MKPAFKPGDLITVKEQIGYPVSVFRTRTTDPGPSYYGEIRVIDLACFLTHADPAIVIYHDTDVMWNACNTLVICRYGLVWVWANEFRNVGGQE